MLKLTDFIAAMQTAIDNAAQLVAQQNFANLRTYFQQQPSDAASSGAASNSLDENVLLKPKMVTMVYPKDTAKGVVEHHVQVPLLSLAPISHLQPEEINLEIELEFVEKDDQVLIGFPQLKRGLFGNDKLVETKPNAKLTMKISTSSRPAGISAIIEGYDKSLRAQIPN